LKNQRHTYSLATGFIASTLIFFVAIGTAIAQQTTGDILGTVTDSSGAIVPKAAITVENVATHEIRKAVTSDGGDYVVNLLNPGTYNVSAAAPGFQRFIVSSVILAAGDRTRVNAQMAVGQATETITVQAQGSALKTDSSVLSTTVSEQSVHDLPLNGRNYVQLVQLVPGANEGPPDSAVGGTHFDDRRQSASVSMNGQSELFNNEMMDGADNNERLIGSLAVRPSVEAVAELSVQSNTYTAESGRTGGAIINVITKSGTDQFHGTVFEYFRNDILDANTFNFGKILPKAEVRLNQYGASLGGPIKKDKTFFFGDYEGYRSIAGTNPSVNLVPTLYEEKHPGDFSDIGGAVLTAAQIDPVGLDYFSMYPAPNQGTNQFVAAYNKVQYSTDIDARVDHSFNASNTMYSRFAYNKVYANSPGALPNVTVAGITLDPSGGASSAKDLDFNELINYIHIFNSNLLVELKASYTHSDNETIPESEGLNPNQAFGQPNINSVIGDASGLASISVTQGTGLGQETFQILEDKDNTFQYLGAVTYTRGAHNFKVGATIIRRELTSVQSHFPEGSWVFPTYQSLLQGQYSNTQRSLELDFPHLRTWEPSFYIQDDWHVARELTLNLGVRYDLYTPFTEIENRISTWDPVSGSLWVAGQNGVSNTAGIKTDYHGVAPRIGFAYSPQPGFVIRGGFGIGYIPMNNTSAANLKNPPFVATVSSCSYKTCGAGYTTFAQGFPVITPTSISTPGSSIPTAETPNYRTSYLEQFNLTVQKDWGGNVVTASYVGLLGRELAQLLADLNAPPPNLCGANLACYQPLRPYYKVQPNLGQIQFLQFGGESSYHALQLSFQRNLKAGLTFNVNYNWAHSLDNATPMSEQLAQGYGSVPSLVDTRDYGNSLLDIGNRIVGLAGTQTSSTYGQPVRRSQLSALRT
jgi:hypothetical protein